MTLHAPALKAASDFYVRFPAARAARIVLTLAQRLAPSLAVRAAYRLFGTPLPRRTVAGAWPPLSTHAPLSPQAGALWQHISWPFERASLTLHRAVHAAATARPVVLLVHGWGGHAGQMLPLAQALFARGFDPVLLDLPAHGASAGRTSNLPQFARAIDYVAARLAHEADGDASAEPAPPLAVVAHSLAANALAYAAGRGLAAQRLVLLAPPASPRDYMRLFAHAFGLSDATRAALQRRIEAREAMLMQRFEPPAVGPRVAQPTLVVHDRGDRVNRFADGEAFVSAIAQSRLVATDGLGHTRLLADAGVAAAVADFLLEVDPKAG